MTITLPPDLESALKAKAEHLGTSPETVALDALREKFPPSRPPIEPRDEWELRLLEIGVDCGVSIPNEVLSSEGLCPQSCL
jgi:hypothetical protein